MAEDVLRGPTEDPPEDQGVATTAAELHQQPAPTSPRSRAPQHPRLERAVGEAAAVLVEDLRLDRKLLGLHANDRGLDLPRQEGVHASGGLRGRCSIKENGGDLLLTEGQLARLERIREDDIHGLRLGFGKQSLLEEGHLGGFVAQAKVGGEAVGAFLGSTVEVALGQRTASPPAGECAGTWWKHAAPEDVVRSGVRVARHLEWLSKASSADKAAEISRGVLAQCMNTRQVEVSGFQCRHCRLGRHIGSCCCDSRALHRRLQSH
mmetsp:Transcript_19261/g.57844  ORF Transcript_19261/g.57844 Transcript_19261/m.57844 type:complete len:264 (+) Transcript_19261:552-1343(+)